MNDQIETLARQINDLQEALRNATETLHRLQQDHSPRDANHPLYAPVDMGPDPYDPD